MTDPEVDSVPRPVKRPTGKIFLGLVFIGVGLWILSSSNSPEAPSLEPLIHQEAKKEPRISDSRVSVVKCRIEEPFDKVVAFYVSKFGGKIYGDPSMTSSGVRFYRASYAFRATLCTGSGPRLNAGSKTFLQQTNNAIYFVHVSSPSTNGPASVWLSSFRFAGRGGNIESLLSNYAYPNALSGSSAGGGTIKSQRYTTKDSLDDVWRYYQTKLGIMTNQTSAGVISMDRGAASSGSSRNYLVLFPEMDESGLREKGFMRFENEQAIFVTVSRAKDDDKTHITMNAISW